MSIEVRVPKEIMEYKEKIIFGLSIRQLICFILAIIIGVVTYYFGQKIVGANVVSYIVILEVMPIFGVGFIKKNGFTFEKYTVLMFRHIFGSNRRVYKPELLIDEINLYKNVSDSKKKRKRGDSNVSNYKIKKNKAADKKQRECEAFEITKKSRERKRKEAIREIKAAQQECRTKKQTITKTAKKGSSTTDSTTDNQVQKNV